MKPEDFVGAGDQWIDGGERPAVKKAVAANPKQPDPPADYAVLWVPVYCSNCGNRNCPPYDSGDKVTRYHKCPVCKHNFKSIEIVPEAVKILRERWKKRHP